MPLRLTCWLSWSRLGCVPIALAFLACCDCGTRERGANGPDGADDDTTSVEDTTAEDTTPRDTSDPYGFISQRDVPSAASGDPMGIPVKIAQERWQHYIAREPDEAGRLFRSLDRVGFAADEGRFYVVTAGIPSAPHGFPRYLLHAIDLADGHEAWRVDLTVAVYPAGTLVDDDGNILVVANQDGFQGIGYAYKVSAEGEFLWQINPPTDPGDALAGYGTRIAPALDWENNYYFHRGATISSTDSDGKPRWTQLLAPEVRFGCSEGTFGSLFVLDDAVWFIGQCGIFSFAFDGEVRVWKPWAVGSAVFVHSGIPLPDGTLLAAGGDRATFLDRSAQTLGTVANIRHEEDSSLLALANDAFLSVHADSYGFDRARRSWYVGMNQTLNSMIDEYGHLIAQTDEDHVNVLDAAEGTWIAVYDVGRRVTGELGVVPRAGELVVPLNLARDGYRAAAVSCVEIPELGLPAPGLWSRRDGNQKNQRRYRTQPRLPAEDPR